jgi:hypothetical protein
LKDKLDKAAELLWQVRALLIEVQPHLTRQDDKYAIKSIITDLAWDSENCSVMSKHQIGEALDDTMGY